MYIYHNHIYHTPMFCFLLLKYLICWYPTRTCWVGKIIDRHSGTPYVIMCVSSNQPLPS